MSENDSVNEYLKRLMTEACLHAPRTDERREELSEIVRVVIKSGQLWKENTPYYRDALQQTWLYLCENPERYDPARGTLINWLDKHLKWRLKDFRQTNRQQEVRRIAVRLTRTEKVCEQIEVDDEEMENLPAHPDIPPILEETRRWIETDLSRELRKTYVRGRPDVNCQMLILLRLPPETRWQTIAKKFNIPQSTAETFYQREALPLLRKFALAQGYID